MSRKNKRHPAELKYQAVGEYLGGKGSHREICRKYGIRSTYTLRKWIKLYNGHKELAGTTLFHVSIQDILRRKLR